MRPKPKLVFPFLLTALILVIAVGSYCWLSQKPTVPLEKTYAVGSGLHSPVYIAIAKGYLKKEGLDVTLQEYNTGIARGANQ